MSLICRGWLRPGRRCFMHESVDPIGACSVRYFLGAFLELDTACTNRDERRRLLCPAPGVMIRDVPKHSGQWAMGMPAEDAVSSSPRRIRCSFPRQEF